MEKEILKEAKRALSNYPIKVREIKLLTNRSGGKKRVWEIITDRGEIILKKNEIY